jgi:hypothetical protein
MSDNNIITNDSFDSTKILPILDYIDVPQNSVEEKKLYFIKAIIEIRNNFIKEFFWNAKIMGTLTTIGWWIMGYVMIISIDDTISYVEYLGPIAYVVFGVVLHAYIYVMFKFYPRIIRQFDNSLQKYDLHEPNLRIGVRECVFISGQPETYSPDEIFLKYELLNSNVVPENIEMKYNKVTFDWYPYLTQFEQKLLLFFLLCKTFGIPLFVILLCLIGLFSRK